MNRLAENCLYIPAGAADASLTMATLAGPHMAPPSGLAPATEITEQLHTRKDISTNYKLLDITALLTGSQHGIVAHH